MKLSMVNGMCSIKKMRNGVIDVLVVGDDVKPSAMIIGSCAVVA